MHATVLNNITIGTSSSEVSDGVSLSRDACNFSLYYEITGDGDVDFFSYSSVDGENFVKNTKAIKRGLTKTSGPGGDGRGILQVPIFPCDAVSIEAENTDASNAATVTAILGYRPGEFGDFLVYDGVTNSVRTIDYAHHEIHGGSGFTTCKNFTHGAGDSPNILIATPDTTKWAHFIFGVVSDDVMQVDFYEAPDYSGGGAMLSYNRNRNSTGVSGLTFTSDATDDATGKGTLIWTFKAGANKTVTNTQGADRFEFILKQDTKYLLEIVGANGDLITVLFDWYEHTNR